MKAINFKNQTLETSKEGSVTSFSGLVLKAFLLEINDYIYYRKGGMQGKKGFFTYGEKVVSKEIRQYLSIL